MELTYKNKKYSIESEFKNGVDIFNINNEKSELLIKKWDENHFKITDGDKSYDVYAADDESKIYVNIEGSLYTFDKIKDEESSFGIVDANAGNKDIIRPPMPGSIVKVIVANGQEVKEGDGLIIVEAMKMETTLYSSINGKVTEINVKSGEQVDADKVLIVVEKN